MNFLQTELHCHNEYSNFQLSKLDPPYDCGITIREQLEQSYKLGLDVLFVTNHNTIDGYKQMLEYRDDHEKFCKIQVYQAEEITTDKGEHIIAYGISEKIRPGQSFEETIDDIKKQNAVSSAPHPFGIVNGIRENAKSCDLIEVFNSNNVDIFANTKASIFAADKKITGIAGSDSHVLSTLGRCTNVIESENSLDDILHSLTHQKIEIVNTGYATVNETLEHLKYQIDNSPEYINDYISRFYPKSKPILSLLNKMYQLNPNSYLWILFYKIAIFALKRISHKINFQNIDGTSLSERSVLNILKMAI